MYLYVKALHIIFVVTWFAGLFYMVRLFIYNREAQDKPEKERIILQQQFSVMIMRLWFGITWPSCILTIIFGIWMLILYGSIPTWLWIKIGFVAGLVAYHFSLHIIYLQHSNQVFRYSSTQLRIWNEVATVFLFAIVMLVVVKDALSLVWSIGGLVSFAVVLLIVVQWYKKITKGYK
ncbi:MAG: CopD family protein [Cytophagales bacterium]|nr:CopD family protein [Cytophagales bacterium]